jgi:hypothetical protein
MDNALVLVQDCCSFSFSIWKTEIMQIIYGEYPPNYKEICEVFDIKDHPGIVFTYGEKLYIPSGEKPDKHLMSHEETHERQHAEMGADAWWERYLVDPGFRFMQELEAYRNQYRSMATLNLEQRVGYLNHIASDLAGPMYGNILTFEEAKAEITKGIILKHVGMAAGKNTRKAKKRERQNRKKARR